MFGIECKMHVININVHAKYSDKTEYVYYRSIYSRPAYILRTLSIQIHLSSAMHIVVFAIEITNYQCMHI